MEKDIKNLIHTKDCRHKFHFGSLIILLDMPLSWVIFVVTIVQKFVNVDLLIANC